MIGDRRATGWRHAPPAPLSVLPSLLFRSDGAWWRYLLVAWPIVTIPTLAIGWIVNRLLPGLPGPELAVSGFNAFLVVIVSPLVETVLMSGPVLLIRRYAGATAAVFGSALLWGVLHSLAAARWGLVIWWPFLIFSIAFIAWRPQGYWRAVLLVAVLHALNNSVPILLVQLFGG